MRDIIRAMLASPCRCWPMSRLAEPGRPAPAPIYFTPPRSRQWRRAPIWVPRRRSRCSPRRRWPAPTSPAGDGDKADKPAKVAPRDAELTKATNDAVAYIRGLATLHARNADWAEKAVREAVSLPYDAALEQHVIDLVANDLPDLLAKANGRRAIVQGRPLLLDTSGLTVTVVEPGLRDRLLSMLTDPSIVYLLLLAGLFGIAFEASHPGIYRTGRGRRHLRAGRRLRPQPAADRLCRACAGAARTGADGRRGLRSVIWRVRAWRRAVRSSSGR